MCDRKDSYLNHYQFTGRILGKGNYSIVREAIGKNTKKKCALKIVDIETDNYMKQHYRREGFFLSQFNHPNIIRLLDLYETGRNFILTLELIPENLCDYVRNYKRGKLEESLARVLFRQITSAVAYIHEKGIIHRDIKLENILIDTNQLIVKLTDFGLSEEWDKKTPLTTICGSPEYTSPEIHEGKPYGSEVDVWALGVVLFAMVVGRLPFEVQCKKPVSKKQRRELFADETRMGIRTVKHQNFMSSTSVCFKDLISKLLNPDQQRRIQIEAVLKHDWFMPEVKIYEAIRYLILNSKNIVKIQHENDLNIQFLHDYARNLKLDLIIYIFYTHFVHQAQYSEHEEVEQQPRPHAALTTINI